jgi:hypothetical protein
MGLKQLLEQGATQLSAGSFPGDAPINDPQSGFVQQNSPDNTYEDEVIGTPNNGSTLINTLGNTALDNTQPLFDTSTLPPNTITDYPALASGEFNGASTQYQTVYSPNNTYLNSISIQDPNSPQISTLDQTGLDNNDTNSVLTTTIPNSTSYPNNYPQLASGEFGGAPSQYESPYNFDNTYLNSIFNINDTPQVNTLNQTGLDNTNNNTAPTTIVPNSITSPTNYGNVPNSPNVKLGEYGGAPSQYNNEYTPNNTYLEQIDSPEFAGIQTTSISGSGLDSDLTTATSTTFAVPNPDSITTYPASDVTHNTLSSGFNSAPQQFNQIWNGQNKYWSFFRTNPTVFNPQGTNTTGRPGILESLINRIVG